MCATNGLPCLSLGFLAVAAKDSKRSVMAFPGFIFSIITFLFLYCKFQHTDACCCSVHKREKLDAVVGWKIILDSDSFLGSIYRFHTLTAVSEAAVRFRFPPTGHPVPPGV